MSFNYIYYCHYLLSYKTNFIITNLANHMKKVSPTRINL